MVESLLLDFLHIFDDLQGASEEDLFIDAEKLLDLGPFSLEHVGRPVDAVFLVEVFVVLGGEGFHKLSAV